MRQADVKMSHEPKADSDDRPPGSVRAAIWLGSVAILVAMVCDASAVVGRHIGIPLLGSIEIVQCAVSVAGASAIAATAQLNLHAAIRVLTDRLPANIQLGGLFITDSLAAIFFAALAFGCGWIAWDLRSGAEATDLLAVPLQPFRLFVTLAFALTATSFAWTAIRSEEKR